MKFCTVRLESDISEEQEREIVRFIKNFRGVLSVELSQILIPAEENTSRSVSSTTGTALSNETPSPPHQSQEQSMRSPVSDSIASPSSRSKNAEEITGRHTINQTIKWAISNRYMTLDELSMLSPDQLVEKAMSILDIMPREEKANLGKEISDLNTN